MIELLTTRGPYFAFVALLVISTYLLLMHRNLFHALIGLYLFQTGIILFFVMAAYIQGASAPILPYPPPEGEPPALINPVPHALMLTAIVVGVATLGVGLAILRQIQDESGSIEDGKVE